MIMATVCHSCNHYSEVTLKHLCCLFVVCWIVNSQWFTYFKITPDEFAEEKHHRETLKWYEVRGELDLMLASVCLSVCLFLCVCLSLCVSVCLSVCLSVCFGLSVCGLWSHICKTKGVPVSISCWSLALSCAVSQCRAACMAQDFFCIKAWRSKS